MRRQIAAGEGPPAGPGRALRLDPAHLPVCFVTADETADDRTRTVEIDRARVLLTRRVRGVLMRLNLPLDAFLGVAVRLVAPADGGEAAAAIVLEHSDASLSVPLHVADETDCLIADWQRWGSVLRRKLLVAEDDGTLREPFATLGRVTLGAVRPRRRRRTALCARRPKIFRRRACARTLRDMPLHAGEREIIARK